MYLNTIYMGHGTYGIEAASREYFGKAPANLDINESAVLAGLVAAPEKYSPFRHEGNSQARKSYVLRRMLDLDCISKSDYDANINKAPKLAESARRGNPINARRRPLLRLVHTFQPPSASYGADRIYRGGLSVYTTIDKDLQTRPRSSSPR